MRKVAVMPIKLNNERLPGKNTKVLGDKPLLCYMLNTVLQSGVADEIYVYCSDASVKDYLPRGVEFLKRPEFLDEPSSNFNQIFDEFIKSVKADVYLYVHATAPFVSVNSIIECTNAVVEEGYDSAFCATVIQDFLWVDGKPLNFDATNLPRSQDLKPIYRETSGIYVIPYDTYLRYHRRIGDKPFIKNVSYMESIDINEIEDFELAELMLKNNNSSTRG